MVRDDKDVHNVLSGWDIYIFPSFVLKCYIASGECLQELGKYLPIKVAAGLHNILGKGWRVGVGVYNIKHQ